MARWHRVTTWAITIACFSSVARKDGATKNITVHAAPSKSSATRNLVWLPLGDSITLGCGTDEASKSQMICSDDSGGYRVPMAWALTQQGFNVTTMGTLRNGPSYVPSQWLAHEGHSNWRIDQIDGILEKSLRSSVVPPDLITIHLGTNDCVQGSSVSTLLLRLRSLLDHILSQTPKSKVFVASIVQDVGKAQCTSKFNKGLPRVVHDLKDEGLQIYYVPMQERTGMCNADEEGSARGLCTSDGVHPTAAGYLKMASAFTLSVGESGALQAISERNPYNV